MNRNKPNTCKSCGEIPKVMTGGPGCALIKCDCGMETTDGSLNRVLAIWNRETSDVKAIVDGPTREGRG